jgi:alpha-L-rhamnosidase
MKVFKLAILLLLAQPVVAQKIIVTDLSCEHKVDPIGLDVVQPRLSWKLNSTARDILQSAYSIRVSTDKKFSAKNIVWQSGKINSGESILQSYGGPALQSGKRYYWQVKVWDAKSESGWSNIAFFETGLLKTTDWQAKWIEPVQDTLKEMPGLLVRKDINLKKSFALLSFSITKISFVFMRHISKLVGLFF